MGFSRESKNMVFGIILLAALALTLYSEPVFSGKPLGLDALGHLSKVSYLKHFPTANWDMAWYAGAPFLDFYSPLFYYLVFLFPNVIFGANLMAWFSIALTSIGIFLLVYHYNRNFLAASISGILFLTVLNTSYYYVSVGNHPFVLAFWTIPFTLLFLEKSLKNKLFFLPYSIVFLASILSHIFITFCLVPLIALRFFIGEGISSSSFKKVLIFLIPPLFLSSFWLFPFLTHSSSYAGDDLGYIPAPEHLLGFGDYTIWGKASGEIGLAFFAFLAAFLAFLWSTNLKKNKMLIYFLASSFLFIALMWGILGKYNPTGIGVVRYIVPLSILICIFAGITLGSFNIERKKFFVLVIFLLLLLGIWVNYNLIRENYEHYSYNKKDNRYGFIQTFIEEESAPFSNNFTNYRFGTSKYVFSETLNFFYPGQSQTFGYYDQGILYPESLLLMGDSIWRSDDFNSTLFFLDWFGIKYFEVGGEDLQHRGKFKDSSLFAEIKTMVIADYSFTMYEYKKASPIVSLFRGNIVSRQSQNIEEIKSLASNNLNSMSIVQLITNENINISHNYTIKKFDVIRGSPDKVEVLSDEIQEGDIILFKEFYHSSWKAKESPSGKPLKIYRTSLDLMAVLPSQGTDKVTFYQVKTLPEILGIVVSLISLLFILLYINYIR